MDRISHTTISDIAACQDWNATLRIVLTILKWLHPDDINHIDKLGLEVEIEETEAEHRFLVAVTQIFLKTHTESGPNSGG